MLWEIKKTLAYRQKQAYIFSFRYSMMEFKGKFSVSAWLISVDDFSFSICSNFCFFNARLFAFLFIWFVCVIMCALYLYSSTFSIKVNRQMSRRQHSRIESVEVLSATRLAHKRVQRENEKKRHRAAAAADVLLSRKTDCSLFHVCVCVRGHDFVWMKLTETRAHSLILYFSFWLKMASQQ